MRTLRSHDDVTPRGPLDGVSKGRIDTTCISFVPALPVRMKEACTLDFRCGRKMGGQVPVAERCLGLLLTR